MTALATFIRAIVDAAPAELNPASPNDNDNEARTKRALIEQAHLLRDEFLQRCDRLGLDRRQLLGPDRPDAS